MSARPTILYFGNDFRAENRTSSHHVARWLAQRFDLIYVESPGLRAPKGNARDVRKLVAKVQLALRGPRDGGDGVTVTTLLQIPLHRFAVVRRANQEIIRLTIKALMWKRGITRPVTWFVVPHLASVAGTLGEAASVYYCIDDYSALPDVDENAVRQMDEELTRRADLVFVASDTLLPAKQALNPHVYLSPHGVDFDHFARAADPATVVPPDAGGLPGPVVGFFGLIEKWIDLDLVDQLAAARPHWTFLMIGRVAVPPEQVPHRPNLHFLGARPYDTLPAYARAFDACLIPYRLTRQVMHANPLKLREYLATGKPIVSVSTPEIDKFADVVAVARTADEFLAALDAALARPSAPEAIQKRQARAAQVSWDARLQRVWRIVEAQLNGGPLPAPDQPPA